jgi:AraC-like DNA-binding protein
METISKVEMHLSSHLTFSTVEDAVSIRSFDWSIDGVEDEFFIPRRLSSYEFFWIKQGSAYVNIDTESLVLSEKSVYCLSPGQIRQFEKKPEIEGYCISVCPNFLQLLQNRAEMMLIFDFSGELRQISVEEGLEKELEQVLDKLEREVRRGASHHSDLLRAWLNIFILYLSSGVSESQVELSSKSDRELFKKFMALLPRYYAEKKMVSEYAEILCVTPNYLNSVVKKITGYPASHHIQQFLVMEAKRYAMFSQLRMKEIANKLGFADYAHFSKFFKNYAGLNFSSYLKEMNPGFS